ncbi:hypothetical protein ACWDUL_17980 [Nocardia niigatensis]|uniref:hypothetical protein n=1 Tax=Nocardia niigatensis TaxID=209249 RepID=UPI00059474B1|nr:hypothetical protein [Nocardia niigatensis]
MDFSYCTAIFLCLTFEEDPSNQTDDIEVVMPGELLFFLLGAGIGGAAMWFVACALAATGYSSTADGATVQSITARLEREGIRNSPSMKGRPPAHRATP